MKISLSHTSYLFMTSSDIHDFNQIGAKHNPLVIRKTINFVRMRGEPTATSTPLPHLSYIRPVALALKGVFARDSEPCPA